MSANLVTSDHNTAMQVLGLHLPARSLWRKCAVVITALAFALLITTSVTHHHLREFESHDCALCAVFGKISEPPPAPAVVQSFQLLSFCLLTSEAELFDYASPYLLPPICGPPQTSA